MKMIHIGKLLVGVTGGAFPPHILDIKEPRA